MPRRNRNVVKSREDHRIELLGAEGMPLRVPGRRVSRRVQRKGCVA